MKSNKTDLKSKSQVPRKTGRPLKEIVPAGKNQPRENIPIKYPEVQNIEIENDITPYEIPEEWPTAEEISNFDFGIEQRRLFTDKFKFNLPQSLIQETFNDLKWLRPDVYIKEKYLIDRLKKQYPNKNIMKISNQIKELYMSQKKSMTLGIISNNNMDLNDDEDMIDKNPEEDVRMISYKQFFMLLNSKIDINIIDHFEREENEEEFKKRKEEYEAEKIKHENHKKDKKATTKLPPLKNFEDKRIEITIAKPSNISMGERYCNYSKWIASQLQIIKDLQIPVLGTGESIFQLIYPQKNGIPIYNPSGRYWVKLFFMGSFRKIEIDDQMPCGKFYECLLPKCSNLDELWPLILSKALLKLFSFKYNTSRYEEIGDTSIIYSLTGYVGEKINLRNDFNVLLKNMLSDENYVKKNKFIVSYINTYTSESQAPYFYRTEVQKKVSFDAPFISNNHQLLLGKSIEDKSEEIDTVSIPTPANKKPEFDRKKSISKSLSRRNTLNDLNKTSDKKLQNPDLRTVKKIFGTVVQSEKEKARKEVFSKKLKSMAVVTSYDNYFESKPNERIHNIFVNYAYSCLEYFTNLHFNMDRLKPLDFSDLKMEIEAHKVSFKTLTKDEKKKYIQDINELKLKQKQQKHDRIENLKIEGKTVNYVKIKNDCSNSPNLFFILPYSDDEIEMAKKCLINGWNFPPPDYFEFSITKKVSIGDINDEVKRASSACSNKFDKKTYLQLIGNTEVYQHEKNLQLKRINGAWISLDEFFSIFNNFLLFHSSSSYKFSKHLNQLMVNQNSFDTSTIQKVIKFTSTKAKTHSNSKYNDSGSLLLVFEPNMDKASELRFSNLNIVYDLVSNSGDFIKQNSKLNSFFHSEQIENLDGDKDYYLIMKSVSCPLGYHLSVYSDYEIEILDYENYQQLHCGYSSYPFKIEYSVIDKNNYFIVARFSFEIKENTEFMFVIKSNDKFLQKLVNAILILNGNRVNLLQKTSIHLTPSNFNSHYFIVFYVNSNYVFSEGSLEIEFISNKNDLKFTNLQHVESFEVTDKYRTNKHGIVFQELVYSPDTVFASLAIKLMKMNQEDTVKKVNDLIPIDIELRMILEIYRLGKLIYRSDNFNGFFVEHIIFEGIPVIAVETKGKPQAKLEQTIKQNSENIPYLLICRLDKSEAPLSIEKFLANEAYWLIRVTSTDNLGFVRDTSKEDEETALIKSWEEREPGRSEKARKSRRKYIIHMKKDHGEELDEEENKLLNEPRLPKAIINENFETTITKNQKKPDPKNQKSNKKEKDKLPELVTEVFNTRNLDMNKVVSVPENHCSIFIKDFMKYCYSKRSHTLQGVTESKTVLDDELVTKTIEDVNNELSRSVTRKEKSVIEDQERKINFEDVLKSHVKLRFLVRRNQVNDKESLMKIREELKMKTQNEKDTENKLKDIIENNDLNSCLIVFKEINVTDNNKLLYKKAFDSICIRKEEQYTNDLKKMTAKDKNNAQKILEEIRQYNLEISDEVIKKLNEIVK